MDSRLLNKLVGERIRRRRKKLGMKQKDLAALMGSSRAALANVETGRQNIILHHIYRFADVLDLELSDLLPDPAELQRTARTNNLPMPDDLSRIQRDQIARLLREPAGDTLQKEGEDDAPERKARSRARRPGNA